MRRPLLWTLVALSAVAALAALVLGGRPAKMQPAAVPAASEPEPEPTVTVPVPVAKLEPAPTDEHPLPDVLVDPAVRIEKATRRLTVFSDGEAVKGYRIALGHEPVGDKEREGDRKTPEGEFYICSRNAGSKYHRSLGISYPNEEDADRGLEDGLISKREHRTIVTAIHRLERPPWKTELGGEIMIHGSGARRGDWTLGCVALDDDDIEELFTALPLGTPVEIVP